MLNAGNVFFINSPIQINSDDAMLCVFLFRVQQNCTLRNNTAILFMNTPIAFIMLANLTLCQYKAQQDLRLQ